MVRLERPSYYFGPFRLDVSEHMLVRDGHPVPLTPKVFDVLKLLVQNAGHLVEKESLLKEVWQDSFVEEGTLNRSVSVLRKALGDSPSGHRYIETVPTRGYRFVAQVTECLDADSNAVTELHGSPAVDVESPHSDSQAILRRSAPAAFRIRISKRAAGATGALMVVAAIAYALVGPTELKRNGAGTFAPVHRQVTFAGREGGPTLSPDGRRIAYVSAATPEKRLMVQELGGGQPLAVFSAPEVGHVRWSPDGSELMIWTRGSGRDGIYIMPQLGGTLRKIAAGQYIACWSPDGSTIAVATYMGGKIWFVNKLGREERTVSLQGIQSPIFDIDWSPANGLLTFITNDNQGRFTVWTIRPDGSGQKKVLTENTEISSARWAPRGDAVYFSRRLNQTFSVFKIPVQGGDENRGAVVATLITGLEAEPTFALSADGTRLVYARAPYHSNLWMVEAGARGHHQRPEAKELTHGTSLIERPSVSPDGTSVVFNIGHEGLANLYVMPITGGPPVQLTSFDSFNLGGVWSPDGKRIAFASTEGDKPRVWTVNADGGIPRALAVSDLSRDSFHLTWSPATQILYQQPGNRNYYELDPETGRERLLVSSPVGWIFSPVQSQDGQKIAVSWSGRPKRGIWIIDVKNGGETPVYVTAAASAMPVGWGPDGRSIYVVEGKNSTYRGLTAHLGETITDAKILRVPVNGGDVQTVADIPFDEIGGVAMAPDGRRFIIAVYSSRSDVWVVDNFDGSSDPRIPRESLSRD